VHAHMCACTQPEHVGNEVCMCRCTWHEGTKQYMHTQCTSMRRHITKCLPYHSYPRAGNGVCFLLYDTASPPCHVMDFVTHSLSFMKWHDLVFSHQNLLSPAYGSSICLMFSSNPVLSPSARYKSVDAKAQLPRPIVGLLTLCRIKALLLNSSKRVRNTCVLHSSPTNPPHFSWGLAASLCFEGIITITRRAVTSQ